MRHDHEEVLQRVNQTVQDPWRGGPLKVSPDPSACDAAAARVRCLKYRRRILDISQKVAAHVAPALSCLEMVDLIYHCLKREQDVFILSKGHGALAQYAVLEGLEIMPKCAVDSYCTPSGILGGHPDRGTPGIEASTGSLGHGLGIAAGMAYAERLKGSDSDIYVLISDGELQEGSTWEALQTAANLRLWNLCVFVDLNDFGALERLSEVHPAVYPVLEKFRAFGWQGVEVNGHDAAALYAGFDKRRGAQPFAVIGHTVKGRGVPFMEGVPMWHYRSPDAEQYCAAVNYLTEVSS